MAMRRDNEFIYVAPPRHEAQAAFKYRGRLGDMTALAMQRAVRGERGYGEAVDYRGKPVIAAWSYIPSYRWGMVVKQDVDEAFALIHQQRLTIAALDGGDGRLGGRRCTLAGADDHAADS